MSKNEFFVSYNSKDFDFVQKVTNELEKNGISFWFAPKDIIATEYYAQKIPGALQESKFLLLFASRNSIGFKSSYDEYEGSEHVRREILLAVEYKKKIFIVNLDNSITSPFFDDIKYQLSLYQWVDVVGLDEQKKIRKIVENARQVLRDETKINRKITDEIVKNLENQLKNGYFETVLNEISRYENNNMISKEIEDDVLFLKIVAILMKYEIPYMNASTVKFLMNNLKALETKNRFIPEVYYLKALIGELYFKFNGLGLKNGNDLKHLKLKADKSGKRCKAKYRKMFKHIKGNEKFENLWLAV